MTDANGNVTTYAYDLNGRKIRETRPSVAGNGTTNTATRAVINYFYDAADHLLREEHVSATGGATRAIVNIYDDFDRLSSKTLQQEGSSNVVEDVATYSYAPQLDATLMTSANNSVVNEGFTYENAPPFANTSFSMAAAQSGNPLGLIQDSYTASIGVTGDWTSLVNGSNSTLISRSFDPAGRLLSASSGSFSATLGYDGYGNKLSQVNSDGNTGAWSYDLDNRTTAVGWVGNTPVSESLSYDLAGNPTSITRENGVYALGFDGLNRIVSSATSGGTANYTRNWSYDALGNRLTDSQNGPGTFTSNFLNANGMSTFAADPDGFGDVIKEVSGSTIKNHSFRVDDRLSSYQSGGTQVAYAYDGLGRMVAKSINDGTNSYTQNLTYVGRGRHILIGKAGDGAVTVYLDEKNLGEHLGEVRSGSSKGYVTDHLGSVLNSDVAGAIHEFGLFGEPSASPMVSIGSSAVDYGFAGYNHDSASGLELTPMRGYESQVGRWLSQDPLGTAADENFYRYVHDRPASFVDPKGLYEPADPTNVVVPVGGGAGGGESGAEGGGEGAEPIQEGPPPSTPTGQSGSPMKVSGSNCPGNVNNLNYTGHAFDEMQSDGITPSVVQNAINTGQSMPGKVPGTTAYYDPSNNVTVIVNSSGSVVTVSRGMINQGGP